MSQRPPLDQVREIIDKEWTKLTAEPGGVDYVLADAAGTPAMWIEPKGATRDRVIFTIHGGGFMSGSIYTHRKMFGHLAKVAGCRALSIEYRLTPEHVYPAALDDAFKAYRWLLQQGHQAHHIAVAGDSSGGGLGVGLLLRLCDQQLPLPACALIISGWIDMTMSGQSYSSQMSAPAIASNPSGTPPSIAFTVVTLDKRSI